MTYKKEEIEKIARCGTDEEIDEFMKKASPEEQMEAVLESTGPQFIKFAEPYTLNFVKDFKLIVLLLIIVSYQDIVDAYLSSDQDEVERLMTLHKKDIQQKMDALFGPFDRLMDITRRLKNES